MIQAAYGLWAAAMHQSYRRLSMERLIAAGVDVVYRAADAAL
jgi:ABC-type hemin transport system substrate-binding protein